MKKKIIAIVIAMTLVVTGAVGATLAYLFDEDSDVNVFTLGNVHVKQIEMQRDENGELELFEQGKRLLPGYKNDGWEKYEWGDAVTAEGAWNDLFGADYGVMDKFVFVENTGKTEAYFRTVVAVEYPEGISADAIHVNITSYPLFKWSEWVDTEINGVNYSIIVATYTEALQPGEIARPSFLQVALDSKATNEDMELLGETLDVLVCTQAIQGYGFDATADKTAAEVGLEEGFGAITADDHPWKDKSVNVVVAAPEAGTVRPAGYIPNLAGETIDGLVVLDDSTDDVNLRALYTKTGKLTGDLAVNNSYLNGTYAMNLNADAPYNAVLSADNTDFRGWVSYSGFASASFTDCSFGQNSNAEVYNVIRPYDETVFKNCEFFETELYLDKLSGATVTLENCTYNGEPITAEILATMVAEGSVESVILK